MLDPAFYVSVWYQTQVLVLTHHAPHLLNYLLAPPPFEIQSHYVDQGDLERRDPSACASGVLVLKVCTTMPGPSSNFLKLIMRNKFSFKR